MNELHCQDLLGKKRNLSDENNRLRYLVFTLLIVTFRETGMSEAMQALIIHCSFLV